MGKSKSAVTGKWYLLAFHDLLGLQADALLELQIEDQTAWQGEVTDNATINVDALNVLGGEQDQGGVQGPMSVMFGGEDQTPNAYLSATFGTRTAAWRGFTTIAWEGGKWGANSPYAHKESFKARFGVRMWEGGCWYAEKAMIGHIGPVTPAQILVTGNAKTLGGPMWATAQPGQAFQGLAQSTGADMTSATPAWANGVWVVLSQSGVRYMGSTDTTWQTGTVTASHSFGVVVGGASGWLAPYTDKSYVPPFHVASGALPIAFSETYPTATDTIGGDAASVIGRSCNPAIVGGKYVLGGERAFLSADQPGGPYVAQWDWLSEIAAGRDPNGASIIDWYDICPGPAGYYAVIHWHFDTAVARLQVIRSSDLDDWSTFDVLVDIGPGGSNKPAQVCEGGGFVVCYASNGNLWTSANGWATPITTGLTGPGITDIEIGALMQGGRRIVYAGGLFYAFGAGDEYVTFDAVTMTVSAPITLPIDSIVGAAVSPEVATPGSVKTMNPVHILYYLQTQPGRCAEPTANMADANLKAAADWYYAQGFGLCGTRKAASVSPADYIRQIEKVAGCAFVRSPVDGKFYVNIANGEYDLDSLPILTDDDVLSFKETPTVLNEAINSVSVKYFDPAKKLTVTTAPVRALALIAAFGERRQTLDYPEIPTAELANRVALRELLGFITPVRKFELDTKPTTNGYLRGQYFRLQLPKRGIADMVCEVGEMEYGKLVSGGNRLTAVQDTIKVPDAAYVGIEHGVDTRPSQIPLPVVDQRLLEAPYLEVCQQLGRAELEALPPETGYLVAVAADPGESRDFTLSVAPDGGAYAASGYGDFCPTATLVAAIGYADTGPLALANAKMLASVQVGDPVLLEDELCRVDGIDATALTITLGRACADTVPARHAAGARLYFYTDHRAYSTTEYTDGELVHAKLLTNTPSRQLDPAAATAMDMTFDQRQFRPYPPAKFRVNTEADPTYLFGALTVTWVHRDRVLQADQLLDTEAATVGPEAGTTYTMRTYLDGTLDDTQTGITGTSATVTPSGDGRVRIEVESVRDSVTSLQMQVREFDWTATEMSPLLLQSGATVHTQTDDPIYLQG